MGPPASSGDLRYSGVIDQAPGDELDRPPIEIRAEVRPDGESETAERAAENLVRSPLNS